MIRAAFLVLVVVLQCCMSTAMGVVKVDDKKERIDYDSIFVAKTGDSIRAPFYRLFSFHTNVVDWFLATPNATMEIDLSPRHRSRYSILFTAKVNPATRNHTINPRWVYNVSSVKGEFRRYWRTGNAEGAKSEVAYYPGKEKDFEKPYWKQIDRDSTIWGPLSRWSYIRRRTLSARYAKHPRSWRAYYLGIYGAYNKFSICLDGKGKQGSAMSVGLSAGYSVPLYKRLDGSGWDLDIGASAGVMMPEYNEYRYYKESGCYAFTKKQESKPILMAQELRISLAYRFRSIDQKVLYGATRFALHEDKRHRRMLERQAKIDLKAAAKDSTMRYTDLNSMVEKSKAQLALYTDTTAYYYEVLRYAIEYVDKHSEEIRYDSDWQFKREVLMRYLQYYMAITNEMAPEELRTDWQERAVTRQKQKQQAEKERKQLEKEAGKRQKKEQKQAKATGEKAPRTETIEIKHGNENGMEEEHSDVEEVKTDVPPVEKEESEVIESESTEDSEDSPTTPTEEGGEE